MFFNRKRWNEKGGVGKKDDETLEWCGWDFKKFCDLSAFLRYCRDFWEI